MDGERFDHLTRRLAGSLPRRRLLRSAAAALMGVGLAGRAGGVRAQETCDQCQARGLDCCSHNGFPFCRAANQTCCGPIICAEGYACVGGFCVACPPEKKCGSTCCNDGQSCENEECVDACPTGTTRCGETNCCDEGQDCSDGECVDACPVGAAGRRGDRREVTAEAACEPEPCPTGQVRCRGECVAACTGKSSLDGNTCTCTKKKCPDGKLKCDGKCIDPQTDRTHCGGCSGADGASCGAGPCCHGQCQAAGATCCGAQVCQAGEVCCGGETKTCCAAAQCCGPGCCPEGQYCARSNAKRGFCCPNGQQDCNQGCCGPGDICVNFRHSICCPQDRPKYCRKNDTCVADRRDCK